MKNETVEIVFFQLAEGVNEADFLTAAKGVEGWLQKAAGFRRRELNQDNAGNWVDIVYWDSLEQAQQAAAQIMEMPEGQLFGSKIAGETIKMYHMHPVHRL